MHVWLNAGGDNDFPNPVGKLANVINDTGRAPGTFLK